MIGVRVERLYCPIGSCGWTHDRESPPQTTHTLPDGHSPVRDGPAATLQEAIADVAYATLLHDALEVEGVVREHLETHTLLEWFTEVMRLRRLLDAKREISDRGSVEVTAEVASVADYSGDYVPVLCSTCGSLVGSVHPLVKPEARRCGNCTGVGRHG